MQPVAGEVVDAGRDTIYFHGGGSALAAGAFDPDQPLVSTHGCVRLHNQDVNSLIGVVNQLDLDGDAVGQIFVGDAPYLNGLAGQKNQDGKYLYPDLRIALGLEQPPREEAQQQQQRR